MDNLYNELKINKITYKLQLILVVWWGLLFGGGGVGLRTGGLEVS